MDIDDDDEEQIHPSVQRHLGHYDPDEFTLLGKIKMIW
jgi:hypothetical protein